MRNILLIGVVALLPLGATAAYAGGAAGISLGNVDVRALEPPVDVTNQQLEAQAPQGLTQGRSAYRYRQQAPAAFDFDRQ